MNIQKDIDLLICYYGTADFTGSGIMRFTFSPEKNKFKIQQDIKIGGKINFVLETNDKVFVPVKTQTSNLKIYQKQSQGIVEEKTIPTEHFYSYGVMKNNDYGYFSSYVSGVDSIINVKQEKEYDIHYQSVNNDSKSHYIGMLDNGSIYALDNVNNKVIIYQDDKSQWKVYSSMDVGVGAPRLMPLHPSKRLAYLLMERSNQIVVLKYTDTFAEIQRMNVPGVVDNQDFCGGIAVNKDGTYLCVTIRGQDAIALFKIQDTGNISYIHSVPCGKMPRDIIIKDNYVFITCTNSNKIEVMQIRDSVLHMISSVLPVNMPITFASQNFNV